MPPRASTYAASVEECDAFELAKRQLTWNRNGTKSFLIVAVVSDGHRHFAHNWAIGECPCCSPSPDHLAYADCAAMRQRQYNKFFVVCLDTNVYDYLRKWLPETHVVMAPARWRAMLKSQQVEKEAVWDTEAFFTLSQTKTVVAYHLLAYGFNLIFTDVDLVWISERMIECQR